MCGFYSWVFWRHTFLGLNNWKILTKLIWYTYLICIYIPKLVYIQSDLMSHIFLTFLGLGKKTYLQDSKHWSIKNITCPLISGSSFLYSFSSKFTKVFFSSREGVFGVWSIFAFLRLSTPETPEVLPKVKSSMTGA